MALRLSLLSLALLSAATVAGPQPKIVNGQSAAVGSWPAMAHLIFPSVQASDNDHYCGGLHLGDGVMVTAAHCVQPASITRDRVCMGNQLTTNRNLCFPVIGADKFVEEFDWGTADIALVRFAVPPTGLPSATLADSATDGSLVTGELLTQIGYGSQSFEGKQQSQRLRQLNLPLLSAQDCALAMSLTQNQMWDLICLRHAGGGPSYGDSGSPLFIQRQGRAVPIALFSGFNAASSAHVRYLPYHDWIAETVTPWVANIKRTLDLVIGGEAHEAIATVVLHNWSTSQRSLKLQLPAAAPLLVDDSLCQDVAPMAACELTVSTDLTLTQQTATATELVLGWDDGVAYGSLQVNTHIAQPSAETVLPLEADWSLTDGWQLKATQVSAKIESAGPAALVVAQVEGPGVVAMTMTSSTTSGADSFSFSVDGERQWNASGQCSPGQMSVTLAEGQHRLVWQLSTTAASGAAPVEARIDGLAWVEQPLPAAEPSCTLRTIPSSSASKGKSGGGSFAATTLLGLIGLALWRRRSFTK